MTDEERRELDALLDRAFELTAAIDATIDRESDDAELALGRLADLLRSSPPLADELARRVASGAHFEPFASVLLELPREVDVPELYERLVIGGPPYLRRRVWSMWLRKDARRRMDRWGLFGVAFAGSDEDARLDAARAFERWVHGEGTVDDAARELVEQVRDREPSIEVRRALQRGLDALSVGLPQWELVVDEEPTPAVIAALRSELALSPKEALALRSRLPGVVRRADPSVSNLPAVAARLCERGLRASARRPE